MDYTIGITTFSKRYELLVTLIKQIRSFTDKTIIISINGEKDGEFEGETDGETEEVGEEVGEEEDGEREGAAVPVARQANFTAMNSSENASRISSRNEVLGDDSDHASCACTRHVLLLYAPANRHALYAVNASSRAWVERM